MRIKKLGLIVLFNVFFFNGISKDMPKGNEFRQADSPCNESIIRKKNIVISSNFPGGNIVVNKISADTAYLKPDLSFIEGKWFYWFFKISGISDKTITFKFEQDNVFAKYGPAYSINNDNTWKWYGENRVINNSFSFSFSEQDTIAFFSVAFPYTEKDLYKFMTTLNNKELLKIDTLCFTPQKRVVEKITIPPLKHSPKSRILITARHHACEMMANYVLEGIIDCILNDRNTEYLRENMEVIIIPFMDKDGVENGEQGKNRIPRDHNRDYDDNSIYSSVSALKKNISEWNDDKLKFALDIHCPGLRGDYGNMIYLAGSSNKEIEKNQIIFSQLLEKNSLGELKCFHKAFIPYGTSWNISQNYIRGMSFEQWVSSLEGISFSGAIEIPYANVSGVMVTKDNTRAFGNAVALTINEYFKLDKIECNYEKNLLQNSKRN